jgi:hypothetical protein
MESIKSVLNKYKYKYRYIDNLNNMGYIYSISVNSTEPQYFINDKQTYITQLD